MFKQIVYAINQTLRIIIVSLIRGYRYLLSPLLGPCCRFYPSCSEYAEMAIKRFGGWKGSYLMVRRLLRCHPFHPGGYDPVEENKIPRGKPRSILFPVRFRGARSKFALATKGEHSHAPLWIPHSVKPRRMRRIIEEKYGGH